MAETALAAIEMSAVNAVYDANAIDPKLGRSNTLSNSVTKGDKYKAQHYRDQNMIRDASGENYKDYSVFSTPISTLGNYGIGLELYFYLLKYLTVLFFIIGGISIWPILVNIDGDYLNTGDNKNFWDEWSIGNVKGYDPFEKDLNKAEDLQDEIDDSYVQIFSADIVYCFFFIVFIVWYGVRSNYVVERNLKNNITPADYAVEVKGLPKENVTVQEVKDHFSMFGDVVEVSFARKFGGLLQKYKKRAELSYKLGTLKLIQEQKHKDVTAKMRIIEKAIQKFDKAISAKENAAAKTHEEMPVIRCYVLFNTTHSMKLCVKTYKNSVKFFQSRNKQPEHLKLKKKYPLKVKKAVEPNNIQWENLEVSHFSRVCRRIFIICISLALMVASVAMIYGLKLYEDDLPTDDDCVDEKVDGDLELDIAEDKYTSDDQKFCYCKQQSYTDLIDDSDLNDYCEDFIYKYTSSIGIRFAASFGVVVVNFFLRIVLTLLSKFERSSSINKEIVKNMMQLFIAMYINTSYVVLFVNANFQDLVFVKDLAFKKYLFNGDYDDLERFWFTKVGSTFVTTMLISIASPNLLYIFLFYPIGACKRRCCWRSYETQHELNNVFLGPVFNIAQRTAQLLMIVFTCFMYSGGIPFLNIVCFFALFVMYWTDKFLILRHYRKPPLYGSDINEKVLIILPFAVVIHCGMSLYTYGSQSVFPKDFIMNSLGYVVPETNTLVERIEMESGIAMIVIMGVSVLLVFFNFTFTKAYSSWRKTRSMKVSSVSFAEQGPYRQEVGNIRKKYLESYLITNNQTYQPLIISIDAAALKARSNIQSPIEDRKIPVSPDMKDANKAQLKKLDIDSSGLEDLVSKDQVTP
jgi:hypothetical protein